MNLLQAIADPNLFAPFFRDRDTWKAWEAFLAVLFGLPLSAEQLEIYQQCTGRSKPPQGEQNEAWLICGRRAGKSFCLALTAVYLATFRDYRPFLQSGERATAMVVCADRKQSRVILRYIGAILKSVPLLTPLVQRETAESFDLQRMVTIEVGTASHRSVRGYSFFAVLADEIAHWRSEDAASPDTEILGALKPGMATIPNAKLLCASSAYARKGELWNAFDRFYGRDDAPLVWRAATRTMNPSVPQSVIDEAMDADPAHAAAEFMSIFRTDVSSFVSLEIIRECIDRGIFERQPQRHLRYFGFCDPSGGSSDSFTLGIAHRAGPRSAPTAILDLLREHKPPFSPEATIEEFSKILRQYRVTTVHGDRYGGEFPRELFRKFGINFQISEKTKSDLYLEMLPLLNSRCIDLLDSNRLVAQLVGLERKTSRSGRDSVDHEIGSHDDLCNAAAGALVKAWTAGASDSDDIWGHRQPRVLMGHDRVKRHGVPKDAGRFQPQLGDRMPRVVSGREGARRVH